jgi:LPXTG-motif cell wall-anchored protein
VITWTLNNASNATVDITSSGSQDGSALTAGSASAAKVIFNPATTPGPGTSTGVGTATGDAVGVVTISLDAFQTSIDTSVTYNGSVTLVGGCGAAPTTTVAPTTTAPATTAPATTVAAPTTTADLGAGSGNLPGTGYHGDTLLAAFALVGLGGLLLLIRRRRIAA